MSNLPSRRAAGALLLLAVMAACHRTTQVSVPGSAGPATQSISITDGESLIRAMHAKYVGRWFKTLTYIQTTSLLGGSGAGASNDQTWYEAYLLPGKLRIDYGNPALGNGGLFLAENNYQFANGIMVRQGTGWNELTLLGYDVYAQPPDVSISILRSLGYQMSRLRTSNFDGRTAFVVGAVNVVDSTSKQFWIERDRMVLVRLREKRVDGRFTDIRLGDYTQAGGGWVAKQSYQFLDGQPRVHQQVSNITANPVLDTTMFDVKKFSTATHWYHR